MIVRSFWEYQLWSSGQKFEIDPSFRQRAALTFAATSTTFVFEEKIMITFYFCNSGLLRLLLHILLETSVEMAPRHSAQRHLMLSFVMLCRN